LRISAPFAVCLLAGVAAAVGGWKLAQSQALKPGNTSFVRFYSPSVLLNSLGWLLFGLGLFLIFILSPMFYIRG
jgi:hypothetical protein